MKDNVEILPELIRLKTLSKLLSMSTQTLRNYIKADILPAIKIGNKFYVTMSGLKEFTNRLIAQNKGLTLEEYNTLIKQEELKRFEEYYNVLKQVKDINN